jgi:hypothetical protein
MTKLIEGMRYLEWQKRNQQGFENLTKIQKKEARNQGYYNRGWDKVLNSWKIICQINNIVTLFEYKLSKGDIIGAIGQSIAEANQAQILVRQSIDALEKNQAFLDQLASATLAKYHTL